MPTEIEGSDSLAELALDMRWSWNHATDPVWRELDAAQHSFEVEVHLHDLDPDLILTARLVPRHAGVAVPLEANFILWQR